MLKITKSKLATSALSATIALAMTSAADAATTISGTHNGLSWTAQSTLVGQTSTATTAGGGNPIYRAAAPKYSGVAALIMTYQSGAQFICSGTVSGGGSAIVTAAHCVTPSAGTGPLVSTVAYFGGGTSPDDFFNGVGTTAVTVGAVRINSGYTGEVIDQNDIAVLNLNALAPVGTTSYDIFTGGDLTGLNFNVAGYGRRSDVGGSIGANLGAGRLRQGDNTFDFRLGDARLGGNLDFLSTNGAQIAFSFLSDFDNGLKANDASCLIGQDSGAGNVFCNLGLGALEVGVAGGDSGGPQFIGGKLAAVTSYGLSFGPDYGDIDGSLNSSFGEFSGYVPTYIHEAFIRSAIAAGVPESSTWMMMIAGFGIVGAGMRRRARVTSVTFG